MRVYDTKIHGCVMWHFVMHKLGTEWTSDEFTLCADIKDDEMAIKSIRLQAIDGMF